MHGFAELNIALLCFAIMASTTGAGGSLANKHSGFRTETGVKACKWYYRVVGSG